MSQLKTVPWYDRNPTQIRENVSSTILPHVATKRISYTVAENRIGAINLLYVSLLRETVATKVGAYTHVYGNYTIGTKITGFIYVNLSKANAIGDRAQIALGTMFFMPEKDKIEFWSVDESTDGTVKYDITLGGLEFDAYPIEELPFQPELPEKDLQAPIEEKPWWQWW